MSDDQIPWIEEPVDISRVERVIEDAMVGIYQVLRQFSDEISAPILRAEFHARAKPGDFDFEPGNIDLIREALSSIRNSVFYAEKRIAGEIRDAHDLCSKNVEELRNRWSDSVDQAEGLAEFASGLQQSVVRLEAEKAARLQEHSPASPDLRAKVLALTSGKCAYCGTEITADPTDGLANFVIDHVVPKSCGGPDHFSNYVPACSRCNSQKATGHVLEFIQRRLVSARVEIAEAAE